MIVPGVETEGDDVTLRKVVPTAQAGADLRPATRVAMRREVQIAIVVRDLDDSALGRRPHVVGIFLYEVLDRLRVAPDFVVQPSVDPWRGAADPKGVQLLSDLLGNHRLRAASALGPARDWSTATARRTQIARSKPSAWHGVPDSTLHAARARNPQPKSTNTGTEITEPTGRFVSDARRRPASMTTLITVSVDLWLRA